MSDLDLIRKARARDERGFFEELERRYVPHLRELAFRILRDEDTVEDVLQRVRLSAWHKMASFDPSRGISVAAWLARVTRNACFDLRRQQRRRERLAMACESHSPTAEEPEALLAAQEAVQQRRESIEARRRAFLDAARRDVEAWPDPLRRHARRILRDPRILNFLDAAANGGTLLSLPQFLLVIRWAADCARPIEERIGPREARAALKVLEALGPVFSNPERGGELDQNLQSLVDYVRAIATRRGTKRRLNCYDFIYRLSVLSRRKGLRLPDKAVAILAEIAFGGRWNAALVAAARARALRLVAR